MNARTFFCWFLVLFAVTQFPLYWVEYPDITDFPNHLARIHTLINLSGSEMLQRYYQLRKMEFGTNLAMEVIVPILAGWISLSLALKAFASLATLLFMGGAVALGRAVVGRFSPLLLGVLLFAQNAIFQLGLFNYIFGIGLVFGMLALWISANGRKTPGHLTAFAAGCIAVYFCHLSAMGVYGIGVVAYQLSLVDRGKLLRLCTWRPLILALTQFVPVLIVHILLWSNSAGSYTPASHSLPGLHIWIVYKSALVLLAPTISFSGYFIVQTVFGMVLAGALYVGFRERVLQLAMPTRWMAGMLAAVIVLLPPSGFGSNLVDMRLIPTCVVLAWCGLEVATCTRLKSRVVLATIASAAILITAATTYQWGARNAEYADVRKALSQVPQGARIATVVLDERNAPLSISPHVGAWSIIDNSAFLSSFYIWPFQPFWVSYRPSYASLALLARTDDPAAAPPGYETLKNNYDYVLVHGGDEAARRQYVASADIVFDSPSVRLLRTYRDQPVNSDSMEPAQRYDIQK